MAGNPDEEGAASRENTVGALRASHLRTVFRCHEMRTSWARAQAVSENKSGAACEPQRMRRCVSQNPILKYLPLIVENGLGLIWLV